MESVWLTSALWIGLALVSSLLSIRLALSVALVEIVMGMIGGNWLGLAATGWVNYLAGVGAILLTFLAGAEVDPEIIRRHFWASIGIGTASFLLPFTGVFLFAYYVSGWSLQQAQIAGLALSTTSVAVVYAVMVETGLNRSEMGKVILAACFVTDLGTVVVLGILFADYDLRLVFFALATAGMLLFLPRFVPWFYRRVGSRVSEPQTKFIFLVLFLLGGLAELAKSEAVLPAYLVGTALAPFFLRERSLAQRLRVMAFTLLTPFYFLKAGALIKVDTIMATTGLIGLFLCAKMVTKFVGVWPLTRMFVVVGPHGMFTTLLMCTGLTFGTICALFGLNNGVIDQDQYTILVTAVIASAVVPTVIAQRWFTPQMDLGEEEKDA